MTLNWVYFAFVTGEPPRGLPAPLASSQRCQRPPFVFRHTQPRKTAGRRLSGHLIILTAPSLVPACLPPAPSARAHAAWSAQALYTTGLIATLNLFWASIPIIVYAFCEQVRAAGALRHVHLCTSRDGPRAGGVSSEGGIPRCTARAPPGRRRRAAALRVPLHSPPPPVPLPAPWRRAAQLQPSVNSGPACVVVVVVAWRSLQSHFKVNHEADLTQRCCRTVGGQCRCLDLSIGRHGVQRSGIPGVGNVAVRASPLSDSRP